MTSCIYSNKTKPADRDVTSDTQRTVRSKTGSQLWSETRSLANLFKFPSAVLTSPTQTILRRSDINALKKLKGVIYKHPVRPRSKHKAISWRTQAFSATETQVILTEFYPGKLNDIDCLEHTTTYGGQNTEFLNVNERGTYSYHSLYRVKSVIIRRWPSLACRGITHTPHLVPHSGLNKDGRHTAHFPFNTQKAAVFCHKLCHKVISCKSCLERTICSCDYRCLQHTRSSGASQRSAYKTQHRLSSLHLVHITDRR